MSIELTILYRGPLASCNYRCDYCPFAKRHETAQQLAVDRAALRRFSDWIRSRTDDRISVLFTPWGEALTRSWYRDTIAEMSHLPQIQRVAIQTNLSWDVSWVGQCNAKSLGLWCTWHPTQVSQDEFVDRCGELDNDGISYSVGIVGLQSAYEPAVELRRRLGPSVYMWVNAYKDVAEYYTPEQIARWTELDPLFPINLRNHPSEGKRCRTGQSVISVDGDGNVRRCHFIPKLLGNLYTDEIESMLRPRCCTNQTCDCHIGYVHLEELAMDKIFGNGLLSRTMP